MSDSLIYLMLGVGVLCLTLCALYWVFEKLLNFWQRDNNVTVTAWLYEPLPEYQPMSRQELRDMELLYGRTFTEHEAYELLRVIKLEDAYEDWAKQ